MCLPLRNIIILSIGEVELKFTLNQRKSCLTCLVLVRISAETDRLKKLRYRLQGFDSRKHVRRAGAIEELHDACQKNDKLSSKENKFQINL